LNVWVLIREWKDVPEGKVKVLSTKEHRNLINNNKLLLEEFVFEAEESEELKKFVELVGAFVGEENRAKDRMRE
jgi:CRISPR-associated protein Cmr4